MLQTIISKIYLRKSIYFRNNPNRTFISGHFIKKGNPGTIIKTDSYYKPFDSGWIPSDNSKLKGLDKLKRFLNQCLYPTGLSNAGIKRQRKRDVIYKLL